MVKKDFFCFNGFSIIVTLILYEPDYFKLVAPLDNVYLILEGIIAIIITSKYLLTKKNSHLVLLVLLFYIPMYLSTLYFNQDLFFAFKKTVLCILFPMLCEIELNIKNYSFFTVMAKTVFVLLILNLVSLILYPNGMVVALQDSLNDKIYFLSNKNGLISWVVVPTTIFMANYYEKRTTTNQRWMIASLIISGIEIIYTKSSTGFIGLLIIFLYFFGRLVKFKNILTIRKAIIVAIIVFLAIVVFRVQNYNITYIQALFGKSDTLIGREWIWDQAYESFKSSPIIGYGIREKTMIQTHYGRSYSAHNFVLDTLINGGIISLLCFVILLYNIIRRCKGCNFKGAFSVFIMSFIVFFICTLTETPVTNFKWWLPMTMLYFSREYTIGLKNDSLQINSVSN